MQSQRQNKANPNEQINRKYNNAAAKVPQIKAMRSEQTQEKPE